MKPVTVQVITYAPTIFYHCQHCEVAFQEMGLGERLRRQEAAESLPDDLALDFQALSDWVHSVLQRYGGRVRIQVVDAVSIEGSIASLRHRIGRYPAVIVDGQKSSAADFSALDQVIERRVATAAAI
jgi:hypothetical protein